MDKPTDDYNATLTQIKSILSQSTLPEMKKYALLATCMAQVAHDCNGTDWPAVKSKLAYTCMTMLEAVEKAEQVMAELKKHAPDPQA